ncbi:MAG: band 7 protein, partial [Pseudonocardia sp.]|nr:band 7 protein [Pseudonocardia sp.]
IGVDKNTTVVFPAPLMSTIGELGSFLARETAAAAAQPGPASVAFPMQAPAANGATPTGTVPNGTVPTGS